MKNLFIFCVLIFGVHAKAADPVESIDPIASTPQVVVVYRNKCPENQENAIQMIKGLIAYERVSSPIAYSSVPGIWEDGSIGAIDLHQSIELMEKAFDWQQADESWTSQYKAIVSACGGNEFEPSYMVAK